MSEPDIVLIQEHAIEACELFLDGIKSDCAMDDEGMVPLSYAIDALRKAFKTVKSREGHSGGKTE